MRILRPLLFPSCVAILAVVCRAKNTRQEAIALIEDAKELSDIRTPNAPAFLLKANITLYLEKGAIEGTYTESWVSGIQWRRETVVGDFHRVEVGKGDKRWLFNSTTNSPHGARVVGTILEPWKVNLDLWKPARIRDRTLDAVSLQCVETEPNAIGTDALCFEKTGGTLAARLRLHDPFRPVAIQTCLYHEYQKFGDKIFPRLVRCFDDAKPTLEVRIVELNVAENLGDALFARPDGARETANCPDSPKLPKVIYQPDPAFPIGEEPPKRPVVLRLTVGLDGRPQDIEVAESVNKAFDSYAVSAVRRWKFEPATCRGLPVEIPIEVEFSFRRR
jgi:TonB family protein